MPSPPLPYKFLQYLAEIENGQDDNQLRIPTLGELSTQLGLSVAKLREQVEVAKALGFVEVRPKVGIRRKPYTFYPAVQQSLLYAITLDWGNFEAFADLRKHLEAAYWYQAVEALTPEDHAELRSLIQQAWEKLDGNPIIIPHAEHRQLHQLIFRRLNNPFVQGILEAYWSAYEAVGFNLYTDYQYLREVWEYHQRIVEAICEGDYQAGYTAFIEHTDLLYHRPQPTSEESVTTDLS